MSSLSQPSTLGTRPKSSSDSSPLVTIRLLKAVSRFAEAHGWIVFTAVTLFFGWGRMNTLASRHLDHDELFTFYVAQAPTLRNLLTLTHTIDLHPPLSYLLVRASFAIFGVSPWSCRLPFLLAFLATSACLFVFLSRVLSPLYGIIAVILFWSTPYAHLANEARPYALLLCFTALMLVSWYRVVDGDGLKGNSWALAMVTASGFGLLLSHVLAALPYAAFFAAELVRFWIRRKSDGRLWVALVVPSISVLAYFPLIRLRYDVTFAEAFQVSPRRLASCYWEGVRYLITPWMLIALIAIAWPFLSKQRDTTFQRASLPAGVSLRSLLLFLFLVPVEIGALFARSGNPFYERYGAVFVIPCVVFPALFLGCRTHCNRLAASSVAILLTVLFVLNTSGNAWLIEQFSSIAPPKVAARLLYFIALPPVGPPPLKSPVPPYLEKGLDAVPPVLHLETLDPDLPFVAGNGPTFLELDQYQAAALRERLYLLTNHEAASTITHSTLFDHYERVKAVFPIRGQVEPYCAFLHEHSEFVVLGGYNHPDTWLLKKLEMDGARLSVVGTYYDDGPIEEHQIYRVSVGSGKCQAHP